jgi:hypothetical protein
VTINPVTHLGGLTVSATVNPNSFVSTAWLQFGLTPNVTIPSRALGPLANISIENDGAGRDPDWHVYSIQGTSARWLGPAPGSTFYNVTMDA